MAMKLVKKLIRKKKLPSPSQIQYLKKLLLIQVHTVPLTSIPKSYDSLFPSGFKQRVEALSDYSIATSGRSVSSVFPNPKVEDRSTLEDYQSN